MKDCSRPLSLPQWYQLCKPQRSKWGQKIPPSRDFFKNFNCYSTEGPNSSFEEIYLLVRFAVMIIIVTLRKNTPIVSSELTILHKHDLISPLNGAGIVNSVFQRTRRSIAVQCLEQGHTSRQGGKMEPGPRPLPFVSQGDSHCSRPMCLSGWSLDFLLVTELVSGIQGNQISQSHQYKIPREE